MWFKVVLLVLFGANVVLSIGQAGGYWRTKHTAAGSAIGAVVNLALWFGVWHYL